MHWNYILPNMDRALPVLCRTLMADGHDTGSRNGRTNEKTMVSITLERPTEREITIHGRKANIAAQIAETAWVLAGRNDIEWLSRYLPRAAEFSDDGKVWRGGYGPRLRSWETSEHVGHVVNLTRVDQLDHVIELLRRDPLTRRAVMSVYNPAVDMADGKDIPCNDFVIFSNRLGKLDMHVTVRSNDLIWGFSGINAFEWSVLQEIVAGMVGVQVGALHFSTASLHVYERHFEKAVELGSPLSDPLTDAKPSPEFNATGMDDVSSLDYMLDAWFVMEERIRTGVVTDIEIDNFPEPMFQSWLRVLRWWWTGDHGYLKPLAGTRLEYATHVAMQPPARMGGEEAAKRTTLVNLGHQLIKENQGNRVRSTLAEFGGGAKKISAVDADKLDIMIHMLSLPSETEQAAKASEFIEMVCTLHLEKDKAYGDSWKKRGESFSIIPNIARKVDRLGGSETSDETSVDTAVDLLVYLAKYNQWLVDESRSDTPGAANATIRLLGNLLPDERDDAFRVEFLKSGFEDLIFAAENGRDRRPIVDAMLGHAYRLAYSLWQAQQLAEILADVDGLADAINAALVSGDEYRANLNQ